MRQRHALFALIALLAVLGGLLAPTEQRGPVRVEPRRNSPFRPAYIVYTFTEDYPVSINTRRPTRIYYLVPTEQSPTHGAGIGDAMLTQDELLDHYHVSPEQLERVPTRLPSRWLSEHRKQLWE